jgi:uncharacterized membrane protein
MTYALIATLAMAGLVNALYFTFAYYGRVKNARWVPEILCAREGSSCVTVVQTPYARVFRVPNSLLGIVYYLAILLWLPWRGAVHFTEEHLWVFLSWTCALVLGGAISVVLGIYLVHALRRVLRVDCPLCYAAHAINILLLILLVVVVVQAI